MTQRASLEILRVPGPPWQRRSGQETVLARFFVLRFARFMKPRIAVRTHRHYNHRSRVCISPGNKPTARSNKGGWLSREKSKISYSIRGHEHKQFRLMSSSPRNPRANCHLDRATDRADTALPELPEDDAIMIAGFGVGVTRPRARGTSWMSASSRKSASLLLSARSYSFACTAELRCPLFARDGWDAERLPCFGGAWIRVVA